MQLKNYEHKYLMHCPFIYLFCPRFSISIRNGWTTTPRRTFTFMVQREEDLTRPKQHNDGQGLDTRGPSPSEIHIIGFGHFSGQHGVAAPYAIAYEQS